MKFFVYAFSLLFAVGCGGQPPVVYDPGHQKTDTEKADVSKSLVSIGYAIQAGAFTNPQNANQLTRALQKEGLDAYYFVHESGLYKVRFGDFPSKVLATKNAETLHAKGIIDVYYVVGPEDYPLAKTKQYGEIYVRKEIVKTAERFLGVPYQWGGTTAATGFDCSGLTAAVYELNGLKLPRSSKQQQILSFLPPQEEEGSPMWVFTWRRINSSMHPGKGKQYVLDPFPISILSDVILGRGPIYRQDP
jgi:hypothetical protein